MLCWGKGEPPGGLPRGVHRALGTTSLGPLPPGAPCPSLGDPETLTGGFIVCRPWPSSNLWVRSKVPLPIEEPKVAQLTRGRVGSACGDSVPPTYVHARGLRGSGCLTDTALGCMMHIMIHRN